MRNNNNAQRSNMSVDAILAMDYPDREEWIKATTDQTQQQRRIDHMMPLVVSTKKTQILEPERIPTIEELVQQQLEAMRKPRQRHYMKPRLIGPNQWSATTTKSGN
jgi:hypothetical protein